MRGRPGHYPMGDGIALAFADALPVRFPDPDSRNEARRPAPVGDSRVGRGQGRSSWAEYPDFFPENG